LLEDVLLVDATFFRFNPTRRSVMRRYYTGEAWPFHPPQGSRVTVTLIGPRLRMRRFADGTEVIDVDADPKVQVAV
jgi:hypothetical protein